MPSADGRRGGGNSDVGGTQMRNASWLRNRIPLLAMACSAALLCPGARAQTQAGTDDALEEIIVTAKRRTEELQTASISATVLNQELLEDKGVVDLFALQYAANLGATDLSHAWVWFSAAFSPSASHSCLLYYDRAANQLYLLDDGTSWMGGTLGGFGTLQNSQCSVSLQTSSATLNGSTLTLYVAMTFTSSYAGDKRIFMFARNANNVNSGWQDRGQWTVP